MPLKVWSGSSWVSASALKVWNGSSWVSSSPKIWNGSSWVPFLASVTFTIGALEFDPSSSSIDVYRRDLTAVITGMTAPYTYSWSATQTSGVYSASFIDNTSNPATLRSVVPEAEVSDWEGNVTLTVTDAGSVVASNTQFVSIT